MSLCLSVTKVGRNRVWHPSISAFAGRESVQLPLLTWQTDRTSSEQNAANMNGVHGLLYTFPHYKSYKGWKGFTGQSEEVFCTVQRLTVFEVIMLPSRWILIIKVSARTCSHAEVSNAVLAPCTVCFGQLAKHYGTFL